MTTSLASIVFNDQLPTRVVVPEGTRAQIASFNDLSTIPRTTVPISSSQEERLFVFGYKSTTAGNSPPFVAVTPTGVKIIPVTSSAVSAIIAIYVPATVIANILWSEDVLVQCYQIPFIETIPRLPGRSKSGSLIFTYGSVIEGGTRTSTQGPGSVTPVVPGGILTVTQAISGIVTFNGTDAYIGRMFDASVSYMIAGSVATYSIFVPPTKTGVLPQPTSSSIKTFSFQEQKYRPGEIYAGNQKLVTSILINGVRRAIIVPGARIV